MRAWPRMRARRTCTALTACACAREFFGTSQGTTRDPPRRTLCMTGCSMPWSRGEPPWEERPPARARCSAPAPASVRYEFRTQATVCGVVHGAVEAPREARRLKPANACKAGSKSRATIGIAPGMSRDVVMRLGASRHPRHHTHACHAGRRACICTCIHTRARKRTCMCIRHA